MIRLSMCMVILFSILEYAKATEERGVGLIVNGKDARKGKYPWQILLYRKTRRGAYFLCGGSIINNNYVLTAAHCLIRLEAADVMVAVGKHEMDVDKAYTQYSDVKETIIHESYNTRTDENDIALLQLKTSIEYDTDYVQPVNLAPFGQEAPTKRCYASGFGVANEKTDAIADTLQELKTKVINERKCKKFARKYGAEDLITDQVVCTKDSKSGVCSGDSGGPLGCFERDGNYTQYGVLSWGSTKCKSGFNVYTRVSEYVDWIAANI